MKKSLAVIWLISILMGCATVQYHQVGEGEDEDERGIRYYGSSYYLIAYSNGNGGLVTEIKSMPDQNKLMSVKPSQFLASINSTLTFSNGVLTESEVEATATQVPEAILAAVEKVAGVLAKLLNETGQEKELTREYRVPAPYIYKIVVRGSDVHFYGGQGTTDFKVTILPEQKAASATTPTPSSP
jgi:hypothetical protein